MKITPLDIRQKTFEKKIRGYDKDEVYAFLTFLSQEWEKMMEEKNMLQMKFEQAEREAVKLREVEESLFKTLKTAEDTGASIIEQANKTAELILKEAQMNADALNSESKNKARNVVEEAETQAKNIMEDLKEDISVLVENYEKLLNQRENLLKNLKTLATSTLDNVKDSQEIFNDIDISVHSKTVKDLQRKDKLYSGMGRKPQETRQQEDVKEVLADEGREEAQQPVAEKTGEITKPQDQETASGETAASSENTQEVSDAHEEREKHFPDEQRKEPSDDTSENQNKDRKKESGSFFDQFD